MTGIQINLLRISPDSKYIEFSVECNNDYIFNTLKIKKYDYLDSITYPDNMDGWVDGSHLYQITNPTKQVMRIETSIFGGSSMFYVEFGLSWNSSEIEPLLPNGNKISDTTTIGVCSDINNTYQYLLSDLLKTDCKCSNISDNVKRAFLLLYGHQEAMRLNKVESGNEAEIFYDILKNNFSLCNSEVKSNSNNCNCS